MTHNGDLDARLENWAKAQRFSAAGGSVIGSAEGRYRSENTSPRSIESMLLDQVDADIVERAWSKLMPFDKDVLHMYYIRNMDYRVICRRLKLPRVSQATFDMALAHAKREIGNMLARGVPNRVVIRSTMIRMGA